MFLVYILESARGNLYIGQTDDLTDRLERHNRGGIKYTTNKGPWMIIYTESYTTRSEAIKREKYLKSLKNPKYIKEKIIKK